jgi:KDO2-lipid IV(A) lauroyltransferase
MGFLVYILAYFSIWILYLLPRRLFYSVSDILSILTQYVVRYRKKAVRENLTRAFPAYSLKQIRRIERKFYRHLVDVILESAISHFQSDEKYLRNLRYRNPEVLNQYYRRGKQLISVMGHYGNWEYAASLGGVSDYQVMGTYRPLRNKYFDRLVKKNRERFHNVIIPVSQMTRRMIQYHQQKQPLLTIILTDQRPMFHQIQYWTKFLGIDTPYYTGTERLARKLNAAVVFFKTKKLKRGLYEIELIPICDDPGKMEPDSITEAHVRILETQIREEPAYWLWSHRRWKHSLENYLERKKEDPERGIN